MNDSGSQSASPVGPGERGVSEAPTPADLPDAELLGLLRRRAAERKESGTSSVDSLVEDFAARERMIAIPELEAVRELLASRLDLLEPRPARSFLRRAAARLEWMITRDDSPAVLIARKEAHELNVALMQYSTALARDLADLRSRIAALEAWSLRSLTEEQESSEREVG